MEARDLTVDNKNLVTLIPNDPIGEKLARTDTLVVEFGRSKAHCHDPIAWAIVGFSQHYRCKRMPVKDQISWQRRPRQFGKGGQDIGEVSEGFGGLARGDPSGAIYNERLPRTIFGERGLATTHVASAQGPRDPPC